MKESKKKIIFTCTSRPNYSRNEVILSQLKEKYRIIPLLSNRNSYLSRLLEIVLKFLITKKSDADLIFVGYLAQPLIPFLRLFNKKIITDPLVSLYDTICFDRKLQRPNSPIGKLAFWLDKILCKTSERIILDTNTHIDYFINTFNAPKEKFLIIPICSDTTIFYPETKIKDKKYENKFIIEFYGYFSPLHGVEHILKAAKILENHKDIIFKIVGKGQQSKKLLKLYQELNLKNVELTHAVVPLKELAERKREADLCLGVFGDTSKARRVIVNKIFDSLAVKKPLLTGNTNAEGVKELLQDGIHCLFSKMEDEKDLAEKILILKNNPELRTRIAENGYNLFKKVCDSKQLKQKLYSLIDSCNISPN